MGSDPAHKARGLVLPFIVALLLSLLPLSGQARAATIIVDDDGMQCALPDFTAIQPAINAASNGDTIKVCAGNYPGNLVLGKDLTLNGAQSTVDARGRVASESTITAAGTLLTLISGSASSTIDGFTFMGGTRSIESATGPINAVEILNNRFLGFTGNGLFLNDNGINITIDKNDIDGTAKVGSGDLVHLDTDNFDGLWFTNNNVYNGLTASGFFVDGTRNVDHGPGARLPQFTGNLLNNNQTGTNLGRLAWGDGPITGNTFSNNSFDGLQGGPKNALIADNTFDRNGRNGLTLTSFGNTTDPARGAQFNTIEHNCFMRNGFIPPAGAGIFFSATQFPGTISTNVAHQNNIAGNFIGAQYLGAETINAELNWWNSATGPTHIANPGGTGDSVVDDGNGIDYVPFRTTPAATPPCPTGAPAILTLDPPAKTNTVGTEHCVTATVTDAGLRPVSDVTVRFTVTGSVNTTGSVTTDANGQATFCYFGPPLPGADVIHAYADTNNSNTEDLGEPSGNATKAWVLPTSTEFCEVKITNGGWITAMNGDVANFGGNAKADGDQNLSGQEEYQDHGPAQPMNVHSTEITAITCSDDRTSATIFGNATIDGSTMTWIFRIDVIDMGSPSTNDAYGIMLSNGYNSGVQSLGGGNITIH
jgi:hypothetical protein